MSPYMRVLWALFYKFFGAGLVFLSSIITAAFLGPVGRGFLTAVTNNLAMYSPVAGAYSEYIPYGINKRKHPPGEVFSAALVYYLFFFAVVFGVALLATPWFWQSFDAGEPSKAMTYWIAGLVAPFALFHVYVTRLVWGLNQLEWLNRLNTVQPLLFVPMVFWAVTATGDEGYKTIFAFLAWLTSFFLTSCISAYVAVKHGKVRLLPKRKTPLFKEIASYGNQLAGSRLLTQINARIDFFFVFYLISIETAGIYSIAVTVADMLLFVSSSLLQVVFTRVSSLEERDSTLLTARTFRHTGVIMIASLLFFYTVMPNVIKLAYDERFEPALGPYYILLPGLALLGMTNVLTTYFTNQLGRPKTLIYLETVSIFSNITLTGLFLAGLKWGAQGIAAAKTGGYTIIFLVALIYFCKTTGYPVWKMFVLQEDEIGQYKKLLAKIFGRLRQKDR
jgi:O-antigen/teichoic acid export membrane protein